MNVVVEIRLGHEEEKMSKALLDNLVKNLDVMGIIE